MSRLAPLLALLLALALLRPAGAGAPLRPLTEMGSSSYLGFAGGLYPGGNAMPAPHHARGEAARDRVQPRAPDGTPHAGGAIVWLSIGMSNTAQEWCGTSDDGVTCNAWSFMGRAAADPSVDHGALRLLNGALGGLGAEQWRDPAAPAYNRIRDRILGPQGLSEAQVQVVWLKVANPGAGNHPSLPSADADAYRLLRQMGEIVRALRVRYPQLAQVWLSSRIYAGYASTLLNPEPHAYESGFAVKWLIEAQIAQAAGAPPDPLAGDLGPTVAPWLGWAAYLWADGPNPRADGLRWLPEDFEPDGTHPSSSGESKVAQQLLAAWKGDSLAWPTLLDLPFALYLPFQGR